MARCFDRTCPCRDGLACHYEDVGDTKAWTPSERAGELVWFSLGRDHDAIRQPRRGWIVAEGDGTYDIQDDGSAGRPSLTGTIWRVPAELVDLKERCIVETPDGLVLATLDESGEPFRPPGSV